MRDLDKFDAALRRFLRANKLTADDTTARKVAAFAINLCEPPKPVIPFEGKLFEEISKTQRYFFKADHYEGFPECEFLGHKEAAFYFLFSRRTVQPRELYLVAKSPLHFVLQHYCTDTSDPAIDMADFRKEIPRTVQWRKRLPVLGFGTGGVRDMRSTPKVEPWMRFSVPTEIVYRALSVFTGLAHVGILPGGENAHPALVLSTRWMALAIFGNTH